MANPFIVLLLINLVSELVMTTPVVDYDAINRTSLSLQKHALETLSNSTISSSQVLLNAASTKEELAFEAIVQFERFLTEGKVNFLSPSLYLEDPKVHDIMYTRLKDNRRIEKRCLSHINHVINAAKRRLPWAIDMIDSAGKPCAGVFRGNNLFVGDFDQCIDVDSGLGFEGQYCTTRVLISQIRNTTLTPSLQFALGLCFPSSCAAVDVENYINSYFQSNLGISVTAQQTNCQERHLSLTTKAKWFISICSIFVLLLVSGTIYDVVYKRWYLKGEGPQSNSESSNGSASFGSDKSPSENEPIIDPNLRKPKLYSSDEKAQTEKSSTVYNTCDKVLMSFSVYTNTAKLFAVSESQDSLGCTNGMLFISLAWVILLQTYSLGGRTLENITPFYDEMNDDWIFMTVITAVNGVDTLFAISGLLATFVALKKLTKEKVSPKFIGGFYLHRYIRLTPPYMLILMTYVPLFKYISDGPFWPQNGIEIDECKDTWWINLLFLNNFIKEYKMCMGWSWFLACDIQFYLVSPLIFLPLSFLGWKGLIVPFAFLLGNGICSGVISNVKDFIAIDWLDPTRAGSLQAIREHMKYFCIKPYTRIGPFIIGMVTGFLLFKSECKARLPKLAVVLGWMASTAIALAVMYGPYDHVTLEDLQSTDVRALYNALHSIAWGISVCWVIFACANGYGGFVNTLLSWKALIPLSRLTFCSYLVHPLVIQFYFLSQREPFYMNNLNMAFAFVAVLVMSYAVAYIAYMAYEVPVVELVTVIRGKRK